MSGRDVPGRITEKLVHEWFRDMFTARRVYVRDVVHVSEVSGCLRRSWYVRRYGEKLTGPDKIIFMLGNGIHEALQSYLRDRYGWQSEVKVTVPLRSGAGEFQLVGHVDVYDPDNNRVLEIKTTSTLPDEPRHNHVLQANAYTFMVGAREAVIIYIDKKHGRVRPFTVPRKPELWRAVLTRARVLHEHVVRARPPAPYRGGWCMYCPFAERCFRSEGLPAPNLKRFMREKH